MQLSQGTKSLLNLTKQAYSGEVMLPDFQRNFVWTRQDVEELLKSLLENMFIGTFLIHNVDPKNPPFKTIAIAGAVETNKNFKENPNILILDGQQRLSSFFYALYSPNTNLRNVSNPYKFFINITELLNDNIDDAIISWSSEWREHKKLLDEFGNYKYDALLLQKIIPLTFLKDDFTEIWYEYYKNSFSDDESKKIRAYVKNIIEYQIMTLDVPVNEKPENIAVLFEKINRTGVKLSIFDLLTARLYKFLNLRTEWENSYDEYLEIQKFVSNNKSDTSVPYYLIQSIALYDNLSIKARDMLGINEKHINKEVWKSTIKIFNDNVLKRLLDKNEYGIADINRWMPYKPMIIILVSLFKNEKKDINKINQWYLSSVFSERYSSSTETKFTKDYKELIVWFKNDEKIPEVVNEMREILYKTFSLKDKKYAGSSIYKGIFNLLFINDAKDFYKNDKIKFEESLDDHHIFPKQFLIDNDVKVDFDTVLNRTLITKNTNIAISKKSPSDYLKIMLENNNNDESIVKSILSKHFIDESMYEILKSINDNSSKDFIEKSFYEFAERRQILIQNEIAKSIGVLI